MTFAMLLSFYEIYAASIELNKSQYTWNIVNHRGTFRSYIKTLRKQLQTIIFKNKIQQ